MAYATTLAFDESRAPRKPAMEMRERSSIRDSFFPQKRGAQARPVSVATEFVDTDWDEDDILSDLEEPIDNSPRASLHSFQSGERSITTLSSYEEATTPRSSRGHMQYEDTQEPRRTQPVEGPSGPHLFRSSTSSSFDDEHVLSLSPLTPATAKLPLRAMDDSAMFSPDETMSRLLHQASGGNSGLHFTRQDLNSADIVSWTPVMVAQSMLNAGVEYAVAASFIDNDINGAILMTLKFEDLKELQIASFGLRTKIWGQIQILRDTKLDSPLPPTPIEDVPCADLEFYSYREAPAHSSSRRLKSTKKQRPGKNLRDDVITPMESVSIVGIEQVIPKPHHCPRGESCTKYKKQKRLMEAFLNEHPLAKYEGGAVLIAGNPGNPETAQRLDPKIIFPDRDVQTIDPARPSKGLEVPDESEVRPISEAVPSVVASSDVLGPGSLPPLEYLRQLNLQKRDPQENVKQFIAFQQTQPMDSSEVPPTPPFEIAPLTPSPPHQGLRGLPKLSIPGKASSPAPGSVRVPSRQSHSRSSSQLSYQAESSGGQSQQSFIPYSMDKASPLAEDLISPSNLYRFGTPFSEMDVPITIQSLGPVSRDVSQSVPPDMSYRVGPSNPVMRSQSRASRRPSFPVMPALVENELSSSSVGGRPVSKTPSPTYRDQRALRAPPRVNYPWSPMERKNPFETAIPPLNIAQTMPIKDAAAAATKSVAPVALTSPERLGGVSFQGPMKKRKTHFLRHEWQDGYFTLKGTRLAMHKDERDLGRTLEYVDVDDYAIACSSFASQSKLSAAFKAVQIRHGREKSDDVAAFNFQLIPQDKGGMRLRKRESMQSGAEGVNGTGKTHHFAVRNRDQRIDWMRELMLAKALKQKGQGYEVSVNGNMI